MSLQVEADISKTPWMCVLCGEDLCRDTARKAQTKLILKGGINLRTGVLGLSAQGPDGKVQPMGHASVNNFFDVLQNAGWKPPLARTPTSSAKFVMAFAQVEDSPFWKAVCLGPHQANPSAIAAVTDGHKLWLTVNGSLVGNAAPITGHFMRSQGWSRATPSKQKSGLLDQKGAVLGLSLGCSILFLALIVLLSVFLHKKCR